jgi:DnaJ domain
MPDPYEIIGVRRDASLDEIRIAYRRSAQVLHPDRFATSSDGVRSEAARRMLQLNGAMEAIEVERADEASGTGGLGSVSFGGRAPGATASAPAAAPPRTPPAPTAPAPESPGPAATNGAPPPAPAPPSAKPSAALSPAPAPEEPAGKPAPKPTAAQTPAPPPSAPAPANEPATPSGRELETYVAPPPPPEPEAIATERRDAFAAEPPRQSARAATPPPAPEPEPEQRSYSLHADSAFSFDDDEYSEYDDLPPVSRRSRTTAGGGRSVVRALIAGAVIIVALAVIAGYFAFGRSSGNGEQTFARSGAPFTFKYPKDFRQRRLDGGVALNKPVYQIGFGLDPSNYLLTSTYKLGFTVQDDGTATGPKGQQLTPDQINHDIDVTIAKLAGQAGFTQKGVQSGSLGSLRARIYDYAKPDGSLSSTFVVALSGTTEYYVTCQSSPRGEQRIAKACDRLLATFSPA